jgi:alpha-mannosidase
VIYLSNVKEIWIYHHSHLDVGYTHPQPVLWELQRKYISQAVALCEKTQNEPEEAKFRWTCEATSPVVKWLEKSSEEEVALFDKFVRNGQICIAALSMHTAPLSNVEQIARMLYPARKLRERFGAKVNTAINHDINGQPWTLAQLLLDAGVELYTTGVNIHFGGLPLPRPLVFRWKSPDGRELLTFNGEHYSVFTQFTELWDKDLEKMKKGIDHYLGRLEKDNYPHDFVYLSSTNIPLLDNTPPDEELMEMVHLWNEANLGPKIRLATPEMLLDRIKELPYEDIPVYEGDWTDYWNFGAASSALETKISRRTKQSLKAAELLSSFQGTEDEHEKSVFKEAWEQLELFDEHTWGANVSITAPDSIYTKTLWMHKAHTAYQANSLSGYLLANQLEALADNPLQSQEPEGVLLVNPTHVPQKVDVRISEEYTYKGRHCQTNRYKFQQNNLDQNYAEPLLGTVELPAFGWKKVAFDKFQKTNHGNVEVTDNAVETPFHRLEFNQKTGRILGLFDKQRNWQMLDQGSQWSLFQYVQETVDPLHHEVNRSALFPRDVEKGNNNISCWNHDWKALRNGAYKNTECRVEQHDSGATLILKWEAPGVDWLEQKITLFAHKPEIEFLAHLKKQDIPTPDGIYFTFPLNLKTWKAKFDSAGTFVELDKEQLPRACKDWVTVDNVVSMFDDEKGVTLACPDAPLVQLGDFNFGKEHSEIPRQERPLLLAWPMNNYWDTNFCATQPGVVSFKYVLSAFSEFEANEALAVGMNAFEPVQIHPAVKCDGEQEGTFLEIDNKSVAALHVKPADDENGIVVRLLNLSEDKEETVALNLPGREVHSAAVTDLLENELKGLTIEDNSVTVTLPARGILTVRMVF